MFWFDFLQKAARCLFPQKHRARNLEARACLLFSVLVRSVDVLDRRPEVVLCYPKAILINEHGICLRPCRDGVGLSSISSCERFRHLLANLRLSNPMFGVVRAKTLGLTHLIENYIATDIIMLAEIALRGEIYEIPEYLFFRRDHPQKSTQANTTVSKQAEWYDPGNKGRDIFLQWKLFSEHLASITRVPIGLHEKLRCYFYMAKWFRWHWNDFKSELVGLANQRISKRKSKRISVRERNDKIEEKDVRDADRPKRSS